jgi:hypothetical protein
MKHLRMKVRLSLMAASAVLVASLSFAASAGAAAKTHPAKYRCGLLLTNQTPTKLNGFEFGVQSCSKPFGSGISIMTYKQTVSGGLVTATGKFKSFFDRGTFHGTYKLKATLPSSGPIFATGTLRIVGTTGNFTGKAKGKMACVTQDGGAHYACVLKF